MRSVTELSLDTNIFSLGSVLGTNGSAELVSQINAASGAGSYFGSEQDPFKAGFQAFMSQVVQPITTSSMLFSGVAATVHKPDAIRPITSIEDLKEGIPSAMYGPILYHQPIREMAEQERIYGFGINPNTLEEKDIYNNALTSGYVELIPENIDKDGYATTTYSWSSDDPELTSEEIEAIRDTRAYIDEFYNSEETRHMDFTDYPMLRS